VKLWDAITTESKSIHVSADKSFTLTQCKKLESKFANGKKTNRVFMTSIP